MLKVGQLVRYADGVTTGVVEEISDRYISVRLNGEGDRWINGNPQYWLPVSVAPQGTQILTDSVLASRDVAYGYASAYGYAAQTLTFILANCDYVLAQTTPDVLNFERQEVAKMRDMAARGIAEANAALRRYDARIETIENGAQYALRRVQSDS